jgi:hypothetical protein
MIEPFRHLINRSILEIQGNMHKKDYAFSRKGIIVISNKLKGKYTAHLSDIFDRKQEQVSEEKMAIKE